MPNHDQLLSALKPLGDYRLNFSNTKFNCPKCEAMGAPLDKFNLEVNLDKNVFRCWACHYKGPIYQLVEAYGYEELSSLFKKAKGKVSQDKARDLALSLPSGLMNAIQSDNAKKYLYSRGFDDYHIKRRDIRYCYEGKMKGQLIFPSYNSQKQLNYWVAHNPSNGKYWRCALNTNVCFWESYIDRYLPIVLVEGIYDTVGLPNALPLLGLNVNDYTLDFLSNCTIILILDKSVAKTAENGIVKLLKSVAKHLSVYTLVDFEDPNEAYVKGFDFIPILKQLYGKIARETDIS